MKHYDASLVRTAGTQMSNWLYNMRQKRGRFNEDERQLMQEMVDQWDEMVKLLPRSRTKSRRPVAR